jgi:predicted ferric reductase
MTVGRTAARMTASAQVAAEPTRPATAPTMPRRVPFPRGWPFHPGDLGAIVSGLGILVVAMWVRHGGLDQLDSVAGTVTAAGQVTALLGTYLALVQLVLMSRSPWLDQLFGMERLAVWHRWLGFSVLWLIAGHTVLSTVGFAMGDGSSVVAEAWTLVTTYPYMLMATVALGLLVMVAVTSVRAMQRNVSYETWHGLHLYAYLAIALGFGHQLAVGTDFSTDPMARAFWIGLYLAALALILVFRVGQPILLNLRHRLRVATVIDEAPGIVSIYVTGRDLGRLACRAGQYFIWRYLTRDGWWRGHPFSLSAAPDGRSLRITIKDLGDDSARYLALRPGTRAFVEGPYGAVTGARRRLGRVLLIAGGIGITPLRALLEEMSDGQGITLLYRASDWSDVVFREELAVLARDRAVEVHYLVGERGGHQHSDDPLGPAALSKLVPDVRLRDVFVCGPTAMMDAVHRALRALRVPPRQIHMERFSY